MVDSKSFVSTQGWDSEKIVVYRINEEEFHKISLMDCDFFIRKPPDPDDDVYDFREMYVTPPDTDVYAIPKVLAPMPQKYIRCAQCDYGGYNVTESPIDAPRDPLYKSEREVWKVRLIYQQHVHLKLAAAFATKADFFFLPFSFSLSAEIRNKCAEKPCNEHLNFMLFNFYFVRLHR